ncbi:hypothetical protein BJF88_06085 [Cellulosimicrobium sp. CUA-896]|nr:hypothetical protein BJF88_06085 [Cellulosimicrobium sp. CUA-896]
MAAAVVALVVRGLDVASTLPSTRVETYLELPVLAGGALAAAWVGVSSLVALVCVAARTAGRTWSRGEHLVARHAPAVVRRAARIGVSVSVGAGLVLGGGSAHAAAPDVADDTTTVAVVDLGWRPSAPQVAPGDTDASADSGTADSPERVEPAVPADGADTDGAHTGEADTDEADADGPGVVGPGAVGTAEPDRSAGSTTADRETTSASPAEAPATAPTGTPAPGAGTPAPGTSAPGTPSGAPSGAPDRLPAAERDAALAVTRDVPAPAGEVVVLRGDTLWAIAARTLPADATDAAVAAEVERWYAANQDTIGADPDLIRPGQVLVAPTA